GSLEFTTIQGENPKFSMSSEGSAEEPRRAIGEVKCDPKVERIWEARETPGPVMTFIDSVGDTGGAWASFGGTSQYEFMCWQIGEDVEREASVESLALVTDRFVKKNVIEATTKAKALQVGDPLPSEKDYSETGPEPGGEEIDTMAVNEVIDVFDGEDNSMALHGEALAPPEQKQQQSPITTVDESRSREQAASAQSRRGKKSAETKAQCQKEKGKGK
ncbi:hypothetical protein Dimus_015878, partial [Dionaea muscipula]